MPEVDTHDLRSGARDRAVVTLRQGARAGARAISVSK